MNNKTKYATTVEEIRSIMIEITDMDMDIKDGETQADYKKRIEELHLPLISRLEGVKIEWLVPDYSGLDFMPENLGEEVIHLNTDNSPVKDIINSVIREMTIK